MLNSISQYVNLSINNNIKFLENMKQGFKRIISWNKYRFKITTQTKINNLSYLIHSIFRNTNRLLVLSFKNENDDWTRGSFNKYYMLLLEMEHFYALIKNNPVRNKQDEHEKLLDMPRNNVYRKSGNLLDYLYHQKYD